MRIDSAFPKHGPGDKQTNPSYQEYEKILERQKSHFEKLWARQTKPSGPLVGYDLIKVLGSGAFGQVILGKHRITNIHYAIKVQKKAHLIKLKQVEHVFNEKRVLESICFPFVINMDFCYKDFSHIYFVLPFLSGGDMFSYLRKVTKFKDDLCKFYGAQVVLALEYLHFIKLVHRDLKPENIMLCDTGYVKLCDFGFCKYVTTRTWSLCGTPDYLAPEVIKMKGYGKSVDWWSFGVLMYEMSSGYAPFYDPDGMKQMERIVGLKYRFPPNMQADLKDLIRNLLQSDLSRRYGSLRKGVIDIKEHRYFKGIDWMDIYEQNPTAPYVPQVRNTGDARYFEAEEEIAISEDIGEQYEQEFKDF